MRATSPLSGRPGMHTSMSMAAITSTLRRHGDGRAYDRCGNRELTCLNPQNFAITIGKPIPPRVRQTIHSVCTDMYEGFVHAAKEVFGKRVKIVIDRFHVAKLYRSGLDSLRKYECKRLKQELSEEAYGQFKGAMWALRKSEEQLTDDDKDVLRCLFEHSPCLKMAYEFCHEFTSIFDTQLSKREGKRQMRKWMDTVRASELRCFDSFLTTLEK